MFATEQKPAASPKSTQSPLTSNADAPNRAAAANQSNEERTLNNVSSSLIQPNQEAQAARLGSSPFKYKQLMQQNKTFGMSHQYFKQYQERADSIIRSERAQQLRRINSSPIKLKSSSGTRAVRGISQQGSRGELQSRGSEANASAEQRESNFFLTNNPSVAQRGPLERPQTVYCQKRSRRAQSLQVSQEAASSQDMINYIESMKLAKQRLLQAQQVQQQRKLSARSQSQGHFTNALFYRNDRKREQYQSYLRSQISTFDRFMNVAYLAQKSNSHDKQEIIQHLNELESNFNKQIGEIRMRDIKLPENPYQSVTSQNIIQSKMEDLRKKYSSINQRLQKIDYFKYFMEKQK